MAASEPVGVRAARITGRRAIAAALITALAGIAVAVWKASGHSVSLHLVGAPVNAPVVVGDHNQVNVHAGPEVVQAQGDEGGPMAIVPLIASEDAYPEGTPSPASTGKPTTTTSV